MSYGRTIWQYHYGTILWIIVVPYDMISDQIPAVYINMISDHTTLYQIRQLDIWYQIYMISDQTWEYQIRQYDIRSDYMISDLTIWYQIWLYVIRSDYMISDQRQLDIRSDYRYQISDLTIWYQIWLYDIRSYNSWCPIFSIGFLVHSWADPMPWEIGIHWWSVVNRQHYRLWRWD